MEGEENRYSRADSRDRRDRRSDSRQRHHSSRSHHSSHRSHRYSPSRSYSRSRSYDRRYCILICIWVVRRSSHRYRHSSNRSRSRSYSSSNRRSSRDRPHYSASSNGYSSSNPSYGSNNSSYQPLVFVFLLRIELTHVDMKVRIPGVMEGVQNPLQENIWRTFNGTWIVWSNLKRTFIMYFIMVFCEVGTSFCDKNVRRGSGKVATWQSNLLSRSEYS